MKLRQKLAAVLAATMIMTTVPVVTMAKTDFSLTNGILVAEKDTQVTAGSLKIEMKDAVDTTGAMFFVNLGNAEWTMPSNTTAAATTVAGGALTDVTVTYQKNSDKELQVTVKKAGSSDGMEDFIIPLAVKLTGGDATVAVDGAGTVISDVAPVIFAKTSEAKATVTAEDAKNIYKSGVIADVKIEEAIKGTLGTDTVKVSLDNTDYEFVGVTAGNLELSKGFSTGVSVTPAGLNVTGDEFEFSLTGASTTAPGRITLKNVKIRTKNGKKPIAGDNISLTVSSANDKVAKTSVKVATSQELSNVIEMKDKKVVDMVAGGKKDVTFSIKENVDDSILETRTVEVRLDKGFLFNDVVTSGNLNTHSLVSTLTGKATIGSYTGTNAVQNLVLVTNDDDKVIGFDFEVKSGVLKTNDTDEIKFSDVTVYMPVDASGETKISAEGRALGSKIETTALNVKAPVTVSSEAYTVKVGLKNQKGGKLVIKETDKDMLKQGKNLEITIDDKDSGLKFTDEPVVTVDGDLKLDTDNIKVSDAGDKITIPVKRSSSTASTITITEIPMSVDRTVPEGKYDLKINGAAVETDCTFEALTAKDFILVGTPNTEDLTTNGLKKGKASFVVGTNKYIINGVEAAMDGAAYVSGGRTMVPVRYVANALGVANQDIYFANGSVTVIAGSKTVSLEVGSKVAKMNGVPVKVMTAAPTVKNGRVYVPVSEIGSLLGVEAKWDAATQTAEFINE